MSNERPITFDPAKDEKNIRNHGVSLTLGEQVIRGLTHERLDTRFDYGEDRFVSFGYVGEKLYVAVWADWDDSVRMISVRPATPKERRAYG
jgi:uncharacterized DUF497 family protein